MHWISLSPPPTPAVWMYTVYPFLSTASCMDVQEVLIFAASIMDMQGVSLSKANSMDMQGVFPSTASSKDVQSVSPSTTSSMNVHDVSLSSASSTGCAGCVVFLMPECRTVRHLVILVPKMNKNTDASTSLVPE
jgi:hypothetical protein